MFGRLPLRGLDCTKMQRGIDVHDKTATAEKAVFMSKAKEASVGMTMEDLKNLEEVIATCEACVDSKDSCEEVCNQCLGDCPFVDWTVQKCNEVLTCTTQTATAEKEVNVAQAPKFFRAEKEVAQGPKWRNAQKAVGQAPKFRNLDEEEEVGSLAMVSSMSEEDWLVYGFAVIGAGFLLVKSAQFFMTTKNAGDHLEFTPIQVQEEI